ncbi:SPOR domain-containing protein [Paracoccaceae bacterium Fryx2]|nr:SPOR domain-containing protein [Paracoccaceae bacterium Fryx2]
MLLKVLSVAVWAAVAGVCAANAQTIDRIGGPRELPPAGYQGQMFVDSRGCVFLRAGYGGQVNWVPRVSRDRKVLCGYPPTAGARRVAPPVMAEAPAPTPMPAPRAVGAPIDTVASLTTAPTIRQKPTGVRVPAASYAPPPVVMPAPRMQVVIAPRPAQVPPPVIVTRPVVRAQTVPATEGCPASSPYGQRAQLTDGRTTFVCAPYPEPLGSRTVAAGAGQPVVVAGQYRQPVQTVTRRQAVVAVIPPAPAGWKQAWTDGRLNPQRGLGTLSGQAAQDQVWTRDVPAELVAAPVTRRVVVSTRSAAKPQVHVSTRSEPPARAATGAAGRFYVQVGSFGEPSNAEGARARLAGLGLPVASQRQSRNGKALQTVLAGPFASAGQAQAALAAARQSGFGDAFIR